ncbi:peptidylprolyl isomerase [Nodularia sp. UHCC 0506]|uniref:peptidylprolyl isomerase n=1 Tax=Nodularia sp. UHCC 0506 TaxID=3110243 RepID=UPI002B1F9BD9|nr:peptidylprolyl isomerase [Nodularia sp. UHCC 0506]MEA5513946.1 peptidylprolyl isomerase [Nodularia sp. UHCC 0506]
MNDSCLEKLSEQTITAPELISLLAGYQMLPQIYRELLIDQAITCIECSPEEVEQAQQEFYTAHSLTNPQQIENWLKLNHIAPAQLQGIATRKLRLEKYKLATWGHKLESYFLTQKSQLDQVTYSLLRTRDMAIAQELYFRIKAKEQSFADIARKYSQGPEAQTGGLIGPMPLSQPHPQLAAKLRASQPGQIMPPMRLGEWVVIVRLEQMIYAKLDDSTRKKLLNDLFQQWLQESLQKTLNQASAKLTPSSFA